MNTLGYWMMQTYCKWVGSQATRWETVFAIYTTSTGLDPGYIKYQKEKILNIRKEKIKSAKKWARALYGQRRGNTETHQEHKKMSHFIHDQRNAKY